MTNQDLLAAGFIFVALLCLMEWRLGKKIDKVGRQVEALWKQSRTQDFDW